MKKLNQILPAAIMIAVVIFAGCKKGDTGPAGPSGTNGTNGTNGNSNVKIFVFGPDTLTSINFAKVHVLDSSIKKDLIDSCVMLVYCELDGLQSFWFPVPGQPAFNPFLTSWYTGWYSPHNNMVFRLTNLDGTDYTGSQRIFTRIKVLIAPPSAFSGHRMKKPVDFNNYYETMQYFGLPAN